MFHRDEYFDAKRAMAENLRWHTPWVEEMLTSLDQVRKQLKELFPEVKLSPEDVTAAVNDRIKGNRTALTQKLDLLQRYRRVRGTLRDDICMLMADYDEESDQHDFAILLLAKARNIVEEIKHANNCKELNENDL